MSSVFLWYATQGENNLKFVIFMLKQLDSSIASLDTMKRFTLPDFTIPTEVQVIFTTSLVLNLSSFAQYFSNGISFHMILPTTVVTQCFSNPVTARSLVRYPQEPQYEIT